MKGWIKTQEGVNIMKEKIKNIFDKVITGFKVLTGQLVPCPVPVTVDNTEQELEDNGMSNYCK